MKKTLYILVLTFVFINIVSAQESFSLYQNTMYRHYDRYVYNADAKFHTAVKPFMKRQVDSVVNIDTLYKIDFNRKVWDIVFNRNLIEYKKDDFHFTIDPLFDFQLGYDKDYEDKSWVNTRGFIVSASIGKNFSLTTRFLENQAEYNDFRRDRVQQHQVIPGQGRPKAYKETGYDWGYAEGYFSYQAGNHFNFQMGHGKNFIGDGYRSLFLSDYAYSYPFFKITADVWNLKYMMLWMQFQDFTHRYDYGTAYDKKWGAFHYLSWNVTKWLNFGFFESVIWQNADSTGYRGFDFNYLNPVIFFRPVEYSVGSPDNVTLGVSGKITLFKKQVFYAQIMIDEFNWEQIKNLKDGWYGNKYALQGGYKTFDLFGIKHLDIQSEVNFVRPFTYSHISSLKNYGHYNVSLAHPLSSNFLESVTFLRYNHKRLFFEARYSYAVHGSDTANLNYGNDIFKPYPTFAQEFDNHLGQAQEVTLKYTTFTVSYLVNPSTNFNLFFSYTNRKESSATTNKNQALFNFGIRTSLENMYFDF